MTFRSAIVFAAVIAMASVAQAQDAKPAAPPENPKIAVVDLLRVLHESASGRAIMEKLEEETARRGKDIRAMEMDLMSLEERIRGGEQRGLSPEKINELKKQYEQGINDYRKKTQDAEREVGEMRENQFKGIEDQIRPILEQLTKDMSLDIIFDRPQSGIVYVHRNLDITDEVLARLKAVEAKAAAALAAKPAAKK